MSRICLDDTFKNHLLRTYPVSPELLDHLLDDLGEYFASDIKAYIGIRHQQLQKEGMQNQAIYHLIQKELGGRRFAAPELSVRQIRRIIYG